MKVLGVIPARYGSSRFPGKPLIDLKGKSMIQRVYEGALKCNLISELIVATDDDRIYDHVVSFGGKAIMTKESHASGTERCQEVALKYPNFDVVINIQGDEPLVKAEQLSQLLEVFTLPEVEIGTLVTRITDLSDMTNPNRIKVILNQIGEALCFSRNPIPSLFKSSEVVLYRHIGLYAYRKKTLQVIANLPPCEWEKSESLEQLRWLYHGIKIQTAYTEIETPNIDVPEDLEKVWKLL